MKRNRAAETREAPSTEKEYLLNPYYPSPQDTGLHSHFLGPRQGVLLLEKTLLAPGDSSALLNELIQTEGIIKEACQVSRQHYLDSLYHSAQDFEAARVDSAHATRKQAIQEAIETFDEDYSRRNDINLALMSSLEILHQWGLSSAPELFSHVSTVEGRRKLNLGLENDHQLTFTQQDKMESIIVPSNTLDKDNNASPTAPLPDLQDSSVSPPDPDLGDESYASESYINAVYSQVPSTAYQGRPLKGATNAVLYLQAEHQEGFPSYRREGWKNFPLQVNYNKSDFSSEQSQMIDKKILELQRKDFENNQPMWPDRAYVMEEMLSKDGQANALRQVALASNFDEAMEIEKDLYSMECYAMKDVWRHCT